jgi:predicted CoA-binding protein
MSEQRVVAVVGASNDRGKYGNKAVRVYQRDGWNPNETQVEGLPALASLRSVPERIDRVTIYVPPAVGLAMLDDVAAVRPDELYINPGAESPELIRRAEELGLHPVQACSILAVGLRPDDF